MTPGRRRRSLVVLALAASVACAVLAHVAIVDHRDPALGAALSLVPLGALCAWIAARTRPRVLAAAFVAAAAGALWLAWGALERHYTSVFFAEHAGINLALALVFGRTLLAGREPLCTRFARMLHGTIPPEVERYTRRVTLAWTVFFAALSAASAALYLAGFLAAWSLLANILSPLLVAAMFAAEYAVRLRALPDWERAGILSGVRAFFRHARGGGLEAPR